MAVSAGIDIQSPAQFYQPLAPYGAWVDLSPYGRCWHPTDVPPGWRPYEIGNWEWTDAGWYWASDEPWAWACYHYGNWAYNPVYGWVWVPGTEWAPAWVVWRESPDYIGWAPCEPGDIAVPDTSFMFVNVHRFHDRLGPGELVFNDPAILRRSHRIGGFRRETRDFDGFRRQIAVNRGPGVATIQRATGRGFTQRPARDLIRQNGIPETARRSPKRPFAQQPQVTQQPAPQRGWVQQPPRLYREAPAVQPAPTGRQEQRIYREAPTAQSPQRQVPQREVTPQATAPAAPRPVPSAPIAVPRRQPLPEASTPATVPRAVPQVPNQVPRRQPPEAATPMVPRQPVLPPAGVERGRSQLEVPRREAVQPPAQPTPPALREQGRKRPDESGE